MGATVNYTVSKDNGETWFAPQVLFTPPAGWECRDTEIATLSNGSVMVSYWEYNDTTEAGVPYVLGELTLPRPVP